MKRTKKKIGLLGPYGHGNLGDAAIQDAHIALLKTACGPVDFIGISMNPEDTALRHGIAAYAYDTDAYRNLNSNRAGHVIESFERLLMRLSKIPVLKPIASGLLWRLPRFRNRYVDFRHWIYVVSKMPSLDALVFSGGGQLDENWGGGIRHPYTIYKWCRIASWFSVKVAFVSIGAGRVDSQDTRYYLKRALKTAHYCSFRDEGSQQIVNSTLLRLDVSKVVPDIAFGYPLDSKLSEARCPKPACVAIGPVPYGDTRRGAWHEKNQSVYAAYLSEMTNLCHQLLESGYQLKFIVGNVRADAYVIDDIVGRLRLVVSEVAHASFTVPEITSVDDLLNEIASVDVVLTSRFHGVLLSFLLSRPVIAISCDRKLDQLMYEAGQADYSVDIDQLNSDEVEKKLNTLWKNRRAIESEIQERVRQYKNAVETQAEVIADLISR